MDIFFNIYPYDPLPWQDFHFINWNKKSPDICKKIKNFLTLNVFVLTKFLIQIDITNTLTVKKILKIPWPFPDNPKFP